MCTSNNSENGSSSSTSTSTTSDFPATPETAPGTSTGVLDEQAKDGEEEEVRTPFPSSGESAPFEYPFAAANPSAPSVISTKPRRQSIAFKVLNLKGPVPPSLLQPPKLRRRKTEHDALATMPTLGPIRRPSESAHETMVNNNEEN